MNSLVTKISGSVEAIKDLFTTLWYSNSFYIIGIRDYDTGKKQVVTGRSIRIWQRARMYFKTMPNNPMMVFTISDENFNLISNGLYDTASKSQRNAMESINGDVETLLQAILEASATRIGKECFDIEFTEAVKLIEEALNV
jgi:hypothetical protein|tara:strand:- start:33 stop:455 length:423 start_codon:yes stop_codon:yes gene_type:complete